MVARLMHLNDGLQGELIPLRLPEVPFRMTRAQLHAPVHDCVPRLSHSFHPLPTMWSLCPPAPPSPSQAAFCSLTMSGS